MLSEASPQTVTHESLFTRVCQMPRALQSRRRRLRLEDMQFYTLVPDQVLVYFIINIQYNTLSMHELRDRQSLRLSGEIRRGGIQRAETPGVRRRGAPWRPVSKSPQRSLCAYLIAAQYTSIANVFTSQLQLQSAPRKRKLVPRPTSGTRLAVFTTPTDPRAPFEKHANGHRAQGSHQERRHERGDAAGRDRLRLTGTRTPVFSYSTFYGVQ